MAGGRVFQGPFQTSAVSYLGNGCGEEVRHVAPALRLHKPLVLEHSMADEGITNHQAGQMLAHHKHLLGLKHTGGSEDVSLRSNTPPTKSIATKKAGGQREYLSFETVGSQKKVIPNNQPTTGLLTIADTGVILTKGKRAPKKKKVKHSTGESKPKKSKRAASRKKASGKSQKRTVDGCELQAPENVQPPTNKTKQIRFREHWVGLNSNEPGVVLVKRPQKLSSAFAPLIRSPSAIPVKLRILRRKVQRRPKPNDTPPVEDGRVHFRVYQAVQKKEGSVPPVIAYTWKVFSRNEKDRQQPVPKSNEKHHQTNIRRVQSQRQNEKEANLYEPRTHQIEMYPTQDQHKYSQQNTHHVRMQTPIQAEMLNFMDQNVPLQHQRIDEQQRSAEYQDASFRGISQEFQNDLEKKEETVQSSQECRQTCQHPMFSIGFKLFQGLHQGETGESVDREDNTPAAGWILSPFEKCVYIPHGLVPRGDSTDIHVEPPEFKPTSDEQVVSTVDLEDANESNVPCKEDSLELAGCDHHTELTTEVAGVQNVVDRLSAAFSALSQFRLLPLGNAVSNEADLEGRKTTARNMAPSRRHQHVQILPPQKVALGKTPGHVPVRFRVIRRRTEELPTLEPAESLEGTPCFGDPVSPFDPVLRFEVLQVQKRKDAEGRKLVTFQPFMKPRQPPSMPETEEQTANFESLLRVSSLGSNHTCITKLFSCPSLETFPSPGIVSNLPKPYGSPSQKAQLVAAKAATRMATRKKCLASSTNTCNTSDGASVSALPTPQALLSPHIHQIGAAEESGKHGGNDAVLEKDSPRKEDAVALRLGERPSGDCTEETPEEQHPIEEPHDLNPRGIPALIPPRQTSGKQSDACNSPVSASCGELGSACKLYLKCNLSLSSCHEDPSNWTSCMYSAQDESAGELVPPVISDTREGSADQHESCAALSSAEEAYRLAREAAATQGKYAEQATRKAAALEAERLATETTAMQIGALRTAAAAALEEANAAAAATEKAVIGAKEHWKLMKSAVFHACRTGDSDETSERGNLSHPVDRLLKPCDSAHYLQPSLLAVSDSVTCMERCCPASFLLHHRRVFQDMTEANKEFISQLDGNGEDKNKQKYSSAEDVHCCMGCTSKSDGGPADAALFPGRKDATSHLLSLSKHATVTNASFDIPNRTEFEQEAFSMTVNHGFVSNQNGQRPYQVRDRHFINQHFHITRERSYPQLRLPLLPNNPPTLKDVQMNQCLEFLPHHTDAVTVLIPVAPSAAPLPESQPAECQSFQRINMEQVNRVEERNAGETTLLPQCPYVVYQNSAQQAPALAYSSCFVRPREFTSNKLVEDTQTKINQRAGHGLGIDVVSCCSCT